MFHSLPLYSKPKSALVGCVMKGALDTALPQSNCKMKYSARELRIASAGFEWLLSQRYISVCMKREPKGGLSGHFLKTLPYLDHRQTRCPGLSPCCETYLWS